LRFSGRFNSTHAMPSSRVTCTVFHEPKDMGAELTRVSRRLTPHACGS
jgi:hypothetical protein